MITDDMGTEEGTVKEPVGRMELDERQIKESLVYKERKYCFCSLGCLTEFQGHRGICVNSSRLKREVGMCRFCVIKARRFC